MRKQAVDYRLCLVTDRETVKGRDLGRCVEAAIQGGVTMVQVREKTASSLAFYETAQRLKALAVRQRIPLIINDRLDIALATEADGLHLGQTDLPLVVARKILGAKKLIGVSVSTVREARLAEKQGADYLGVGAMFPTPSKQDALSVTVAMLKAIKAAVGIPVVAIGGIGPDNVASVMKAGIDGVAIISAVLKADDCRQASAKLLALVTKHLR